MQASSEATNQIQNAPPENNSEMTDQKSWSESSTNPAAMPAALASPSSAAAAAGTDRPVSAADAGTAIPTAEQLDPTSSTTESNLSTSLSKLDISSNAPPNPLARSLSQDLPSSPPAPAPPPKDRPLPTPEDVLSRAETGQRKPSLPALPQKDNDRLHPGYSTSQHHHHHNRSLSGSSILDREPEEEEGQDTKGEIRSIMSQFSPKLPPQSDDNQPENITTTTVVTTTTDESAQNPPLSPIPPRTSSLENLMGIDRGTPRSPVSEKGHPMSPQLTRRFSKNFDPTSPVEPTPPLPAPDPEPPQAFDFHRFLEQLRHRTADPVAKYLRSFLNEFGKRQWQVHEQVKIISDFLEFIHSKMGICEVWNEVSDAEFDNAKEGMEKLVMNRLYSQTFSPAIPSPQAQPKGKRRGNTATTGRRGQHQEDVERDEILAQKVAIYSWVREEHLDINPVGDSGRKFLSLACQELLKINNYRAPRDKVICVLNCCKVIFGLLRHANSTQSADDFVPLLIYVVLRANPEHLVSNIQYILRFRSPDKLGGEAGYYLSSLSGAIQFIEGLDRNSLTINDEDFEKNVEEAVKKIAEKKEPISPVVSSTPRGSVSTEAGLPRGSTASSAPTLDSERKSGEARRSTGSRPSVGADTNPPSGDEEKAAVAGLLRTIQRPLSTIGRIFSDDTSSQAPPPPQQQQLQPGAVEIGPVGTPLPGNTPRTSPGPNVTQEGTPPTNGFPGARHLQPANLAAAESAARQASAETAEAMRIQRAEHENVVGILSSMFPDLDKDVIDDVVRMKEGRVGLAVDACLALST